MIDKTT